MTFQQSQQPHSSCRSGSPRAGWLKLDGLLWAFSRPILFVIPLAAIVTPGCRSEHHDGHAILSHADRVPFVASPLSDSEAATRPCIFITREVKNQGFYGWTIGMTLTDAINSAGGLTEFASHSRIRLFRKGGSLVGAYDFDAILEHKTEDP